MSCTVSYGVDCSFDLDVPPESLIAVCQGPLGETLADPGAAVRQALSEPLEFPALALAMAPGDRIVLALDAGTPQPGVLLAALAEYLVDAGADAENLTVLTAKSDVDPEGEELLQQLPRQWRDALRLEIHDPTAKTQLSLLGQTHDGRPIYLNRTLLDADLVVPVGCLRPTAAMGYHGRYGGLFPAFADEKTVQRYRKPRGVEKRREAAETQRREIDEIGWLIGSQFTVQVVPGGGESLLGVLAGATEKVFEHGERQYAQAWNFRVARRASLVVAAVSGRQGLQTWENLARALSNAARVVAEGGAIALVTQLQAEPGAAVASLAQTEDWQAALRRIRRDCPPDALAAAELIEVADRARVYLLSQLEETAVEELGLAPVSCVAELARLVRRHESCIVMANAQHVVAAAEAD